MNIPLGPLLGLVHLDEMFRKDRGVLGSKDSRMESMKRSEKRLNSSQGKPKPRLETAKVLSKCMMHRITESSSIRILLILSLFVLGFLYAKHSNANPLNTKEQLEAQYEAVGTGFESMMLNHLYKQMRESNELVKMGDQNPFAPSNAEKIFRSMKDAEMIESLAKTGPLGVKKMVIDRLKGRGGIESGRVVEYNNNGASGPARRAIHGTK